MKASLCSVLCLDNDLLKEAKELREKSIEYAIALPKGPSQDERALTVLWTDGEYEVGVGKPGKEAEEGRKHPNPNDMWPFVRRKDGKGKSPDATFKDVFKELEHMRGQSQYALELLACLLVRSALMLDHREEDGWVVYDPPREILEEIKKHVPTAYGLPLEVFLQYIELIALNEDVKYRTRGELRGKSYGPQAGRHNNLTTCAHLIAVFLNRAELVDFAYGFSQMRGVSGLTKPAAKKHFPMLEEKKKETESII